MDWNLLLLTAAATAFVALALSPKKEDSRPGILGELWAFMRVRKKWWLGPVIVFLVFLGFIIVFAEGSALAPFIYTLF